MTKGKIIIISGPSGSGKTTLYKKLLADKKLKGRLVKTISVTTRPRRPGEKANKDYIFVSLKRFLYKKRAGHFIETQKVFGNYYGTPKGNVQKFLRAGKNVLLCIDVKGAKVVFDRFSNVMRIFIKTPSFLILKQRLKNRGVESKEAMELRLKIARQELKEAKKYNYIIVNNNLETAYRKLRGIIYSELNLSLSNISD